MLPLAEKKRTKTQPHFILPRAHLLLMVAFVVVLHHFKVRQSSYYVVPPSLCISSNTCINLLQPLHLKRRH